MSFVVGVVPIFDLEKGGGVVSVALSVLMHALKTFFLSQRLWFVFFVHGEFLGLWFVPTSSLPFSADRGHFSKLS
jgi:hypothetical protein